MSRNAKARRRRVQMNEAPATTAARLCCEGKAAIARGDLNAAEKAYVAAIGLGSQDVDAYNNLAAIYDKNGSKAEEELALLSKAATIAPQNQVVRQNLVTMLRREACAAEQAGRLREALHLFGRWVKIDPEAAAAQRAVGYCHSKLGQWRTAIEYYTVAINLEPNNSMYYCDLGLACFELGLLSEAKGAFQRVLQLEPKSVYAFTHLGLIANLAGLMWVAVNMTRRALEIDPNCGQAHNNLALFMRDQGELTECRREYQEAIRLRPDDPNIFSGYLLSLNDDPDADQNWVASEHKRFGRIVKRTGRTMASRSLDPGRRLRIAYLSPDFRTHSVAYFIAAALEAHDRRNVEITCYATGNREDAMTERIRAATNRWRKTYKMSDDELAAVIQEDEIDVIVELSGHTGNNRLAMLAERIAPVQISYLGYPNTTGLESMDYRITDAVADPHGDADTWCTEKLVRLEGGFLSYSPPSYARDLEVGELPFRRSGQITFGSFNNLAKINDKVLECWAAILARVPGSRILLKARGLRDERIKARVLKAFAGDCAIEEERVCLMGHERTIVNHLQMYNEVDLALDTFPYNGTTTTCEAMWMGVPVITLEGRCHAGRVGASLLTRVGLEEWIATDRADYIEKAVFWAGNATGLAELRMELRDRLGASPLMDGKRLAAELEAVYREAWRTYCQKSHLKALG
jgi:predicted O-linked N-acetylglucosamine transferase (SPINDLY family)